MKKSRNNIHFTYIPECFGITVVQGMSVKHDFKEHFHRSYNLGMLTDGVVLFKSGDNISNICEGTIYLLNPQTSHCFSGYMKREYSYLTLSINKKQFEEIFRDSVVFGTRFLADSQKSQLFKNCISGLLDQNLTVIEKQEILLNMLARLECIRHSSTPIPAANLDNVMEHIQEHYQDPIGLIELALLSHLSPFYFLRIFKKNVGISPFEYIIQLRIKEAQRLLSLGQKIAEVASVTGFYDQSHLSKSFKKYLGISPGEYCHNYFEIKDPS